MYLKVLNRILERPCYTVLTSPYNLKLFLKLRAASLFSFSDINLCTCPERQHWTGSCRAPQEY